MTLGNIKFSLQKLLSGNFNSTLRSLRAALNHGVKNSWLKSNPALSIDFAHRVKVEVKCLSHHVVEKMFRHAQENNRIDSALDDRLFLRPTRIRTGKLTYSNIRISDTEKYVIVPAEISKVKRKRIIPLSDNAIAWMQWYSKATNRQPQGGERMMSKWRLNKLRASRQANYEAAAGEV